MGEHADVLRERRDRVHAVGADWRQQRIDWRCFGKSSERSWGECHSTRARVATASVTRNAADSRDIVGRAPGGKHGGGEREVERRKMESNLRAGGAHLKRNTHHV